MKAANRRPGNLSPVLGNGHFETEIPLAVHGGLDFAELERLGLNPDEILDFSANINPFGPSESVREALANVQLDRYPDCKCLALVRALSNFTGVSPTEILPGNGTSELIWLAAVAFVKPGDHVLVVGPTYGEYARAAKLMGALVSSCEATEKKDFVPDIAEINCQLAARRPRLVFICNPNNPTGVVLNPDAITNWASKFPQSIFAVDEAYLPFAAGVESAINCNAKNVFVLRSMTKDFGLAGLRLGYAVANEKLIASFRQVQPPWSVNALAQAAGIAALDDVAHRDRCLKQIAEAKQELIRGLNHLGLVSVRSAAHFFLVPSARINGAAFREALLDRGVLVRDCASFGFPRYVRIATRRPEENARLLSALQEVL